MKMIVPSALPSSSPPRPPSLQNKKIHPEKNSLCFQKWNFLSLILKKFFYFLKGKLFLYFWKWNNALFSPRSKNKKNPPPQENFLYFRKQTGNKILFQFLHAFQCMQVCCKILCLMMQLIFFQISLYFFNSFSSFIKKDTHLVLSKYLLYELIFGRNIHEDLFFQHLYSQ